MPNISLSISGLADCLAIVNPCLPQVFDAFRPFGVNFTATNGITLSSDPEGTYNQWNTLVSQLEQQSNMSAPAHLVVTRAPPAFDYTIDGMLLDTAVRGVVAVYLDASLYRPDGPAQRSDLVMQVCIHELGHLLDMTHTDGGSDSYANAMQPAFQRRSQTVSAAWQMAVVDAQNRGEATVPAPNPALYYPFGATCRACLRAANTDPRWLPFRGPFRGNYEGAGSNEDRTLEVAATPSPGTETTSVGGALYFSLDIHNRLQYPVDLPLHISSDHGSLRVIVTHEDGEQSFHHPNNVLCSSARQTILPGQRIVRSFALTGQTDRPLFARPGKYQCAIQVIDNSPGSRAELGYASFDVDVVRDSTMEATAWAVTRLLSPKRARGRGIPASPARSGSPGALGHHLTLVQALAIKSRSKREEALKPCLHETYPTALRHIAARELLLEQLRRGNGWHSTARTLRDQFQEAPDNELHEAIKRTGEGWTHFEEGRQSR